MTSIKGKLQHAVTGMPGATPLMGPFHKHTKQSRQWTPITPSLRQAAIDFEYVLNKIAKKPTKAKNIVQNMPGYIGTHDASGLGAGGVWYGGTFRLPPTVWQIEWPKEVQKAPHI